MRYLTLKRLRKAKACDRGLREFKKRFGSRVAITAANARKVNDDPDSGALSLHSLSDLFKLNYCPCDKSFKPAVFARKLIRAISKQVAGGAPTAPAESRGQLCRRCREDQWRRNNRGYWYCVPCSRRGSATSRRQDPAAELFRKARARAKKFGLVFNITVDDVEEALTGRCAILGIPLVTGVGRATDNSPTLDRLNAAWGYEPGNIAVISMRANRGKNDLTAEEHDAIAAWMRTKGLT